MRAKRKGTVVSIKRRLDRSQDLGEVSRGGEAVAGASGDRRVREETELDIVAQGFEIEELGGVGAPRTMSKVLVGFPFESQKGGRRGRE